MPQTQRQAGPAALRCKQLPPTNPASRAGGRAGGRATGLGLRWLGPRPTCTPTLRTQPPFPHPRTAHPHGTSAPWRGWAGARSSSPAAPRRQAACGAGGEGWGQHRRSVSRSCRPTGASSLHRCVPSAGASDRETGMTGQAGARWRMGGSRSPALHHALHQGLAHQLLVLGLQLLQHLRTAGADGAGEGWRVQ